MGAAVLAEHGGVSKALATLAAGIGLLSCVGALVNFQLGECAVSLVALLATER